MTMWVECLAPHRLIMTRGAAFPVSSRPSMQRDRVPEEKAE